MSSPNLSDRNVTAAYSVAIRGFERARLDELSSPYPRLYCDDVTGEREEAESSIFHH